MDSPVWVYLLGWFGITVYGARIVIQWWMSEKARDVQNPAIYWVLSSIGAIILYIYGYLRQDLSILIGESISYYVYMWNLEKMGVYKKVHRITVWIQGLIPVAILLLILRNFPAFTANFLRNEDMPLMLLSYGILGQVVYEGRSIYQLVYSMKHGESCLPLGHWIMAVAGSLMIISYGFIRHDWVLVMGQFSLIFSIRNLMLSVQGLMRRKKASRGTPPQDA